MKKVSKSVIAIVLCFLMLMPVSTVAFAQNTHLIAESEGTKNVSTIEKTFYNVVDKLINSLVGLINMFIPDPDWETTDEYEPEYFMPGMETFLDEPADGAKWSMGYSSASLIQDPTKVVGNYFVGGSLSVSDKLATSLVDDLRVRTIAMSDGSGRGTVVFAVIDGYGISSTDVRAIRGQLSKYCDEKNIVSLNISVLHQHSAIDCFGMNGSITKALLNPFRNIIGADAVNGQDEAYMKNLYNMVEKTTKEAVENMVTGTLRYNEIDMSSYIRDKRDPLVMDTNFDLFRFIPDGTTREIWFTTSAIHCVGYGAGGTDITGDYPYYMEELINNEADADFMVLLGAEQGSSQVHDSLGDTSSLSDQEELRLYGHTLAQLLIDGVKADNGKEISPLLNIKFTEVQYSIDNQILVFAGKMGLVTNKVLKNGNKYYVVSEIGYMELGDDLAVALIPGELASEIAYGGFLTAETSWTGEDWTNTYLQKIVGEDRELLVFGLMNDQVGYIIPGNDYMSILYPENKSLELVALGSETAETTVDVFAALVKSVK